MFSQSMFYLLLCTLLVLVLLCARPLGAFIADVMEGRPNFALRTGRPIEALLYRLCNIDPELEMRWPQYAIALLIFNVIGGRKVRQ